MLTASVVFGLLFISGTVAYWVISQKFQDPQLQEVPVKEEGEKRE